MKETMKAFHNDPAIKAQYLGRVRAHRAADELVKGFYWENGKGCAVGCTIHGGDHRAYEVELGIPMRLARLEDSIFERLPNKQAMSWPERFLEAIPVGADLSRVADRFMWRLLVDEKYGVVRYAKNEQTKRAIKNAGRLYKRRLEGDEPGVSEWRAAEAYAPYATVEAVAYASAAASAAAYASVKAAAAGVTICKQALLLLELLSLSPAKETPANRQTTTRGKQKTGQSEAVKVPQKLMTTWKLTIAKRIGGRWQRDWASGQLEHMSSYFKSRIDAEVACDKANQALVEAACDGLGKDYDDEDERETVAAGLDEYYHVVETNL